MEVYHCKRCASVFDFANKKDGRLCDHCAAPLTYHGQEISPWGEHPMRDYDLFNKPLRQVAIERYLR